MLARYKLKFPKLRKPAPTRFYSRLFILLDFPDFRTSPLLHVTHHPLDAELIGEHAEVRAPELVIQRHHY